MSLTNVAAMAAVPKAFASAADIRTRAMSFLNRRQHVHLMFTAFSGVLTSQFAASLFSRFDNSL
jgi:hypothetical protein